MASENVASPHSSKKRNGRRAIENTESAEKDVTIREGLADILVPSKLHKATNTKPKQNENSIGQSVFYNPIQQFNRDLSVLAIKVFGEDLQIAKKLVTENNKSRGKKRKRDRKEVDPNDSALKNVPADETPRPEGFAAGTDPINGNSTEAATPRDEQHEDTSTENKDQNDETGHKITTDPIYKEWKINFKILDALSATGLRAIRYAKEIPFATSIVANDMSQKAVESITLNVEANGLGDKVTVTCSNAMSHMYTFASSPAQGLPQTGKYDVIDLDPYGTAAPFLDASMQAINDGGLLCVTCTDAGVWASCGYPEKTYALYGGLPIKGHHSHEGGLRLILHAIASAAARYGMAIEPLMSLSIDFYARVFVRVVRSQAEVKLLSGKTMLVYTCDSGCGAWSIQPLAQNKTFQSKDGQSVLKHSLAQGPPSSPLCTHCNTKTHVSGPMYSGPIHNPEFLKAILRSLPDLDPSTYGTLDRIEGMVSIALEETFESDEPDNEEPDLKDNAAVLPTRPVPRMDPAKIDPAPFFFGPSNLAGVLHCRPPSEIAVKGALKHAGYRVSKSHAKRDSIKTDAPWSFIWDIMRKWEREEAPIKEGALKPGQPGWRVLYQNPADGQSPITGSKSPKDNKSNSGTGDGEVKPPEIVFDVELGRDPNRKRLVRYQVNPRENWGPMHRARGAAR